MKILLYEIGGIKMSGISSMTSSYDANSLWNQLNSISKNSTTTADYFSTSLAESNLNSNIISEFNSSSNVSNNPFYDIMSECSSIENGTLETNINSLVKINSSSSTTPDSLNTLSTSTSNPYNYISTLENGSSSGNYLSTLV